MHVKDKIEINKDKIVVVLKILYGKTFSNLWEEGIFPHSQKLVEDTNVYKTV
jgi:hypothetical protein